MVDDSMDVGITELLVGPVPMGRAVLVLVGGALVLGEWFVIVSAEELV